MKNVLTVEQENLILENQKLITYVIQQMKLLNDYEEYYDLAMIGLVKAGKQYDPSKGFKFSTYAVWSIKNEILIYIRKKQSNKRKANYNTISLDKEIEIDKIGHTITLHDRLASNINIEQDIEEKETITELYSAIDKLKEKEKLVICYTYGLNKFPVLKQDEISELLKLSQAQISRIRSKSIKKLRSMLRRNIV